MLQNHLKNIYNKIKEGLILGFLVFVLTSAVSIVYFLSMSKRQDNMKKYMQTLFKEMVPDAKEKYECFLVKSYLLGDEKNHNLYIFSKGYEKIAIVDAVSMGYGGAIHILVASNLEGEILNVRVQSHNETPSLGDKIDVRISNWIESFKGKQVSNDNYMDWNIKKEGGKFDQFTGASITPKAVIKGTYKAGLFIKSLKENDFISLKRCSSEEN